MRSGSDLSRLMAMLAVGLFFAPLGCGPESAPGPTTQDLRAERQALAAKLRKGKPAAARRGRPAAEAADENGLRGADLAFSYNAAGRRDPFRSFRWERREQLAKKARRGPLERFELEQLEVVAVVWDTHRPRAMLADPSGRSYIVSEGARVGKNEGRVIHIGDDLVLVKETYVDFAGERTTKDVELKILRSEGG